MVVSAADNPAEVENTVRTIFRRCVQCPDTAPACPACASDEVCSQTLATCDSCASTSCVKINDSGTSSGSSSSGGSGGPNIGAIVGGVVGGVILISAIVFCIWWFWIRGRRKQQEVEWEEEELESEKARNSQFTMQREARNSTHTVASMASSVITRASNIIQIAYIPGVTNRANGNSSPGLLVPPVPPIPVALSSAQSSPYSTEDQHFFVPGDLRDSTYSGLSNGDGRSIRSSLARSSVATTEFRDDATANPMPAQTVVRGKAAVVSVKSSQASSPTETPGEETPPVPQVAFHQHKGKAPIIRMPSSTDNSIKSPSGSLRSTATIGRPTALSITKGKAKTIKSPSESEGSPQMGLRPLTEVSVSDSVESGRTHERAKQTFARSPDGSETDTEDEHEHSRSRSSLLGRENSYNTPGSQDPNSPFNAANGAATPSGSDSESGSFPLRNQGKDVAGLSTVIEEATKRASRDAKSNFGMAKTTRPGARSPFEDSHAI